MHLVWTKFKMSDKSITSQNPFSVYLIASEKNSRSLSILTISPLNTYFIEHALVFFRACRKFSVFFFRFRKLIQSL